MILDRLGRRLARSLMKGALDFDDAMLEEHIDRLGRELTRPQPGDLVRTQAL